MAWASTVIAEYFAPFLVFPILLGLSLGVPLIGLARLMQVGNRLTVVAGVVLACMVAVVGQHYICYRGDAEVIRKQAESFRQAELRYPGLVEGTAPEPYDGLLDFLCRRADEGRPLVGDCVARATAAWASWSLDGLLVLASALLVVIPAARQPYCGKCRSWFRTIRRGQIDPDSAQRLAQTLEIELPDEITSIAYRIVSCTAGCNPTGFEISCVAKSGKPTSTSLWLTPDQRTEVTKILDTSRTNH